MPTDSSSQPPQKTLVPPSSVTPLQTHDVSPSSSTTSMSQIPIHSGNNGLSSSTHHDPSQLHHIYISPKSTDRRLQSSSSSSTYQYDSESPSPQMAGSPLDYTITRYTLLTLLSFIIFGAVITHQIAMFYLNDIYTNTDTCSVTSMVYVIYIIMIISAIIATLYLSSIILMCILTHRANHQHPEESRDEFYQRRQRYFERLPTIRFKTWYYTNLALAICNSLSWLIAAGVNLCVDNRAKFIFIISFFVPSMYFWLCFIVGSLCQKSMISQDPLCCICIVRNPRSYDDLAGRRNRDADIERYYRRL